MTACQPMAAQRVRGLHGAVVELDALADAHRPRADDERRRARHRRGLRRRAGRGVRGVEVRRLGGELGGAGVDHGEARPQAQGLALRRDRRLRPSRSAWRCRGHRRRPAWRSRAAPPAGPRPRRVRSRRPLEFRPQVARGAPSRPRTRARCRSPRAAPPPARRDAAAPAAARRASRRAAGSGAGRSAEATRVASGLPPRTSGRPRPRWPGRPPAPRYVQGRAPGGILGQEPGTGLLEAAEGLVEGRRRRCGRWP